MTTDSQQPNRLTRLIAATGQPADRIALEPGAQVPAWTARVVALIEFNRYELELVEILPGGFAPLPLPTRLQACNLAEPFTTPGALPPGTLTLLWRVGGNYIFQK